MTFKCPNCSGPLKFDPASGMYTCEYCESRFDQAALDRLEDREEKKPEEKRTSDEGAAVYVCQSCGAEIVTTATTAATFCYYCHNPVILSGRLSGDMMPDAVIPFKITRDEALKRFFEWVKKKRFVPKDFFSESNIEKLSGVYYPYWIGDVNVNARYTGEGLIVNSIVTGNRTVVTTKHYSVVRGGVIGMHDLVARGLKSTDRELDNGIHPFDMKELREFSMGYLSGFMAEKRDVTSKDAESELAPEIKENAEEVLENSARHGYSSVSGSCAIGIADSKFRYALLPSWILTYDGRDKKKYYYAMNGQTGRITGNLPIDKGKLWRLALTVGGSVFALMLLGGWLIW